MRDSFHMCSSLGAQCCRQGGEDIPDIPLEVIQSEPRLHFAEAVAEGPQTGETEDAPESPQLATLEPLSDFESESPKEDQFPKVPGACMRKMAEMRHMESDYQVMRGIPIHRALRQLELWTSPHEIRRRDRSAQVWDLSDKVSSFDFFLSHTWRSKGRWKVLALTMQLGWFHGLLAWSVGVAVMLWLRALDIVTAPWHNIEYILAGRSFATELAPWTVLVAQACLVIGLRMSAYLPFQAKTCFLDVACIHQADPELFQRGIYGIGGCLSVTKELRVLYAPKYLKSLWCVFELVAFRKRHPLGRLKFAPLFIERSAATCALMFWCGTLIKIFALAVADSSFRQSNSVLLYVAIYLLPNIFLVHTMRWNYRDKATLISDLKTFDVDDLICHSTSDRSFILSAIDAWYGSRDAFTDFVRGPLRDELLGLLPSPHLPCAYAALIISGDVAWSADIGLSMYKAGVPGPELLRFLLTHLLYFMCWFWFGLNGVFYLSDKCAPLGRTRLLDWSKTIAVAGAVSLWCLTGFIVRVQVGRSTSELALVCWVVVCLLFPCLILDAFKVCRRCFQRALQQPG